MRMMELATVRTFEEFAIQTPKIGAMPKWARVLIRRANRLTPDPGFTEDDMMVVWERCEGRCAVSGRPFSDERIGSGKAKRAFAPSLDKIEPNLGYVRENVRLVCVAVNFAMNSWGKEVFLRVAEAA